MTVAQLNLENSEAEKRAESNWQERAAHFTDKYSIYSRNMKG